MSKRVLILLATGIILILASFFLFKYESTKIETVEEAGMEPNKGPRKGFWYDRNLGRYVPAKIKDVVVQPAGEEKVDNGNDTEKTT